jgi:hypothetical protein
MADVKKLDANGQDQGSGRMGWSRAEDFELIPAMTSEDQAKQPEKVEAALKGKNVLIGDVVLPADAFTKRPRKAPAKKKS